MLPNVDTHLTVDQILAKNVNRNGNGPWFRSCCNQNFNCNHYHIWQDTGLSLYTVVEMFVPMGGGGGHSPHDWLFTSVHKKC